MKVYKLIQISESRQKAEHYLRELGTGSPKSSYFKVGCISVYLFPEQ